LRAWTRSLPSPGSPPKLSRLQADKPTRPACMLSHANRSRAARSSTARRVLILSCRCSRASSTMPGNGKRRPRQGACVPACLTQTGTSCEHAAGLPYWSEDASSLPPDRRCVGEARSCPRRSGPLLCEAPRSSLNSDAVLLSITPKRCRYGCLQQEAPS
jgi:hypothetical protein